MNSISRHEDIVILRITLNREWQSVVYDITVYQRHSIPFLFHNNVQGGRYEETVVGKRGKIRKRGARKFRN